MRGRLVGLVALGAVLVLPAGAPGSAVTYQADVAHSGFVAEGPNPPLGRKWIRRDLGTNVSYPVIAEGKVYVTAVTGASSSSSSSSSGPTLLYALDRRSGATVWVREVAPLGSPAYGNGRIYVLGDRALDAVSAATGERVWRRDLDSVAGAAPVPDGPVVYASDSRGIHAVSADTGLVLQSDTSFANSGFALVGDRVFVAQHGCVRIALFTRGLVEQVWARGGCPGGGGSSSSGPASPAFHSLPDRTVPFERIWARRSFGDGGIVIDAVTSLGTEQFSSNGGLAFGGELAFLRRPDAVEARNVSSGTIQWRWPSGTRSLAGSPLGVRDAVWTLAGAGDLVALRRGDGAELFRTNIGGTAAGDSSYSGSGTRVHQGMAADADGLLVPNGNRLAALGPGADTPGVDDADKAPGGSTSMTVKVGPRDVGFGGKVVVSGEVRRSSSSSSSSSSEVSDQLELQADPYPYGVWERVAGGAARSGSFQFSHRPDRNTRYRVVDTATAPAVISKTFQVYAYPRFGLRLGYRGRTRTHFSATIDAPDFMNLAKQRMYVYGLRSRRSVGVRLGSIPIQRVKGTRYRARRTIRTPTGPNSNYFYVCVKIKDTRQLTRLNGRKWGCGRSRF